MCFFLTFLYKYPTFTKKINFFDDLELNPQLGLNQVLKGAILSKFNSHLRDLYNWSAFESDETLSRFIEEKKLSPEDAFYLRRAKTLLHQHMDRGNSNLTDATIVDKAIVIKSKFEPIKNSQTPTPVTLDELDEIRSLNKKASTSDEHGDSSQAETTQLTATTPQTLQETKNVDTLDSPTPPTANLDPTEVEKPKDKGEYEALEFRGSTKEYFKIWIVNAFFTLATLGIYSAWAKVRTNRYFYANTFYKDDAFEYTANPLSILKGRVLIVLFYGAFIYSAQVLLNPTIALSIAAVALLAMPWIINRAIKFKLKTVKYRNVNFAYHKDAGEFYKFFTIHTLLNILTIGLAYPYSLNKFKELVVSNSSYGGEKFSYSGKTGEMYGNYLLVIAHTLVLVFVFGVIVGASTYIMKRVSMTSPDMMWLMMMGSIAMSYLIYIASLTYTKAIYDAIIQNYSWKNSSLGGIKFRTNYKSSKLGWIYFSNLVVLILSLGLLYPWTKVRVTKYKTQNFEIKSDDLDNFVVTAQKEQSAVGEEFDDFFDIDIGF